MEKVKFRSFRGEQVYLYERILLEPKEVSDLIVMGAPGKTDPSTGFLGGVADEGRPTARDAVAAHKEADDEEPAMALTETMDRRRIHLLRGSAEPPAPVFAMPGWPR